MSPATPPEMHWSRWGDPAEAGPLPESAFALVDAFIGTSQTPAVDPADVRLSEPLAADLLAGLEEIVGAEHVLTDHETRLHRTRGKSTPDLLRLRAGDGSDSPDAVVRPGTHEEVAALIEWCVTHRVALVPFGGGTSVVGGLVASRGDLAGVVSLDLLRFDRLLAVDTGSMTATLEPGLRGPQAEALLAEHGLTLGHFPQSFEYASIGGFAVTRSSGQSSSGYGRFDSLVVGLRVATPQGELVLGNSPANAAGPDLRQVVMGSEGAFGVVTAVTVRVRPRARREGLRDLALGLLRQRRCRDAHARAVGCAPDRAASLRRGRDVDQPRRSRRGRPRAGAGVDRWLPDGDRLRGHPGGGRREAHRLHRPALRPRGHLARRADRLGRRPLPRPLPARLAARRRRTGGDAGDGDVLVQPAPGVRRGQQCAHHLPRRRHAGALPHLARLRDRRLALLHGGHEAVRRPARASGSPPSRPLRTRSSTTAPRSRTTTPSARTTSRGWHARSARSAYACCARSRPSSTRPAYSTQGC